MRIRPFAVVSVAALLWAAANSRADAPPTFMVCTDDDRSHVEPTVKFYLELEAKKIPTEMHIYTYGGHGYALRPTQKPSPVMTWPDRLKDWLKDRGLSN